MDPKDILDLAQQIADLDIPGTLRCAATVADIADHFQKMAGEAPGDVTLFETELRPLGKGAWWCPGRNLVAHRGRTAWSFWSFTLLPPFASKRAYRDDLGGLVVRPVWRLATDRLVPELTSKVASTTIEQMRAWPTLEETGRRELAWIEGTFGVLIPEGTKTTLLRVVDGQAHLRWRLNRLEVKDKLIPLDGGAARDLGDWE